MSRVHALAVAGGLGVSLIAIAVGAYSIGHREGERGSRTGRAPLPATAIPAEAILTPCETYPTTPSDKPCIAQSAVTPDGGHASNTIPALPHEALTLTGNAIHLSHRGAVLIEGFEGFSSCRYFDGYGGVWTRGYGETEGINSGSPCITRAYAERNLIYRAERFYGFAIKRLHTSFNQNEIDAQFSFLWNLGAYIDPPGSSLAIGFQHHSCNGILAYDRAGGVVLSGLVRRRRAECQRFHEPAHEETPAQHRARVHRERVAKLHTDYHSRKRINRVLVANKCLHGYDHKRRKVKHLCTKERQHHGAVARDIKRLHKLGIR